MKNTQRMKVKGMEKIFHANRNKESWTNDTHEIYIYIITKKIKRDKKEQYITMEESIQEKHIIIVNTYIPT